MRASAVVRPDVFYVFGMFLDSEGVFQRLADGEVNLLFTSTSGHARTCILCKEPAIKAFGVK